MMGEIDIDLNEEEQTEMSAPTHLGADVLIGMMPTEVILDGTLSRLTSKTEWKPMHVALTKDEVCIARSGDKILRERIPLLEVEKVRQCDCAPRADESGPTNARLSTISRASRAFSMHSGLSGASLLPLASLIDASANEGQRIMEVATMKDGYNCGKIYYLKAASEEQCASWIAALKSTIAVARARAAPHPLAKYQRRLRHVYRHPWFQSVIAVSICHCFRRQSFFKCSTEPVISGDLTRDPIAGAHLCLLPFQHRADRTSVLGYKHALGRRCN
jgi:hypothetical protein